MKITGVWRVRELFPLSQCKESVLVRVAIGRKGCRVFWFDKKKTEI